MAKADLGNVMKMTDKDIHLTISDMSWDELIEASPVSPASNSLIISAPQNENDEDLDIYSIFASDYVGNIVPLVPFNTVNEDMFRVVSSYNGCRKLELATRIGDMYVPDCPDASIKDYVDYKVNTLRNEVLGIIKTFHNSYLDNYGASNNVNLNNVNNNENNSILRNNIDWEYNF